MAFTLSEVFATVFGDKRVGCYKVTGDGSDTTVDLPVTVIDGAWFQEGTDTGASTNNMITWSGKTVTFSSTLDASGYGHLFYIGT